jgi:hypothetical protein
MEKDTVPLSLPSESTTPPVIGGSTAGLSPDVPGVLPLGALAKVSVFALHPAMSRTRAAKKSVSPALSVDGSRKFRS